MAATAARHIAEALTTQTRQSTMCRIEVQAICAVSLGKRARSGAILIRNAYPTSSNPNAVRSAFQSDSKSSSVTPASTSSLRRTGTRSTLFLPDRQRRPRVAPFVACRCLSESTAGRSSCFFCINSPNWCVGRHLPMHALLPDVVLVEINGTRTLSLLPDNPVVHVDRRAIVVAAHLIAADKPADTRPLSCSSA